ncbi:alpha-ketoacid dehydrogenase subunit alpha/beta [Mesoterricola silvestris]|uniref:Tungsten formylmethanofuran dehydrogenase subunit E n=1 Tax=Mesoterricola silvestris TaxID=2927979 RepID=A0AA48GP31_9BACT|nr:dehydrogenase E1 component subunit alpha/beta [Mesoterricola silvestris]BDU71387.1 tungsten formylmethanofuran dehydrogenase subunit E [Mesoterricola silvestris]
MAKTETVPDITSLTREQRVGLFRTIYASRRIDDREIMGKRQNKVYFQINGAGHEALQAAAALCLVPGKDWFFLYYRDRALSYALGVSARDMFMGSVGSRLDPATGGRMMPGHWSDHRINIFTTSSPTGTQFLQAVGAAEALLRAEREGLQGRLGMTSDEVVLVTSGDGTVAEGEFWESVNSAVNLQVPLVYLIEDNGYAISVPTEVQYPGANVAALLKGWEAQGLKVIDGVDGCDPVASYEAVREAVAHARARKGPALVRARVVRPYSHSLSDDEQLYKTPAQREDEARRDPLATYPARLLREGLLTPGELEALKAEVDAEVDRAWEEAADAPPPESGTGSRHLYSEEVDPTSAAFDREAHAGDQGTGAKTMIDLINITLKQEMAANPLILAFGEDVADASRPEILDELKGKGGVFKATHGLQRIFGENRVFNSPLAEATIVGRAIGLAARGFKPVVEIQFMDYIWPAMQQIRDELATIRWRSDNHFKAPVVIRVPIGGYLMGGSVYHSQCGESSFTHIPGLRVVYPSRALDAAGLLRTAMRCDDPVLFLEPKHLYRQTHNKGNDPGPDFMIPFGKARTVREGTDLSVITYGSTVYRAVQAARQAEAEGLSVEILDLRTLNPYDWDAIVATVKKTRRVLVAHEDTLQWGYGAELAARIADDLFFELDAPVKRLAAQDTWVAYHPALEDEILPQSTHFLEAYRTLARI